jgi:hypothetical protein
MPESINLSLEIPRVQVGLLSMSGPLTGLDAALQPYLDGQKTEGPSSTTYPLAIADGVGISIPFKLPLLGQQEVMLDHRAGVLWLGVPAMAHAFVLPRVAHRLCGSPENRMGMVFFPMRLQGEDSITIPLASLGNLSVRVRA